MDAAYLRAAKPETFFVLGKQLRPFCLGHEILLQRFENGFSLESPRDPTFEDLFLGVHLCSQPYGLNVSLARFNIPRRVRLYTWWVGPSYIAEEYEKFGRYIAAHSELPDFYSITKRENATERTVGAPTIQTVKVSLMANLHLSEIEALNTPFSLAFWNHLTWGEMQESVQIVDESEREKQRQNAELMKENEAKLDAIAKRFSKC